MIDKIFSTICFGAFPLLLTVSCLLPNRLYAQDGKQKQTIYQCMPCGNACDTISFYKPGKCPHCHMDLVEKTTATMGSIEPSAICGYLKTHPNTLLLDVRTVDEFEGKRSPDYGTLKNAINIPVQQLEPRLSELSQYKDREIIVYCSHSQRSPRAGYMLLQNGFTKVTNMAGGMSVMKDNSCKK